MNKWLLAILLVCVSVGTAQADQWQALGRGYYTRINSYGTNDGWYYKLQSTCTYNCGYPSYSNSYVKHSRISTYYPSAKTAGVTYSTNWKADLVRALDKKADNEMFLRAIRESGLANGGGLPLSGAYVNAGAYGNGYARGTTIYQQGFQAPYAEQGDTLYGLASYAPGIGQIDIEGLLQTQARIVERLAENTSQSNFAFSDRIQQVSESQTEIAKIREAGAVLVETLKAAQPPRSVTHSWESRAEAGTESGTGQDEAGDDSRPLETPPPPGVQRNGRNAPEGQRGASTGQSGQRSPVTSSALELVRAQVAVQEYFNQNCLDCHGTVNPKKKLSLAHIETWKRDQNKVYGPKIIERLTTNDKTRMMPPPASGGQEPNEIQGRAIQLLWGETIAARKEG